MACFQSDNLILVITDIGEEIDDETALYYLIQYIKKNQYNTRLHILTVSGNISALNRKNRFLELFHNIPNNVLIGCIDNIDDVNFLTLGNYNQKYILQIGPYYDLKCANLIHQNLNNYTYFLLGDLGKSVNSNGNHQDFAQYLYNNAQSNFIIQTKFQGKTVIPCYSMEISEWFGTILQEEILKLGFKNTFGRAPPNSYTAHLVGPNGANYESVKYLYETITKCSFDDIIISKLSKNVALEYFQKVNENPLNIGFRENQYKILNQNEELQIIGLSRIIEALFLLFDFPKTIIYSIDPMFDSIQIYFNKQWNIYLKTLTKYHNLPLTPCYDLIASFAVIKSIQNLYHNYFDENGVFIYYDNYTSFKTFLNEFI